MADERAKKLVLWFEEIGIADVPLVGGKNASLGEMYQQLDKQKGVTIPNGFAVTASAYRYFIDKANLQDKIKAALADLNPENTRELSKAGATVRRLIMSAEFPADLEAAIVENYKKLEKLYGEYVDVAVRSSATAEDLPDASFAGQQETYLNVVGVQSLLESCKRCMASLFTNRAISYRFHKGFDHFDVALSICVQLMVRSDEAASGVIFTIDTETGFKNLVLITAAWGLGENVVGGKVNPDEFLVFKNTLASDHKPIIQKKLGSKEWTMIYDDEGSKFTKNVPTEKSMKEKFCVSEEEIIQLAKWACIIEDHYTQKRGQFTPMDIEWAKDGRSGKLYIVQARPETVQSQKNDHKLITYKRVEDGKCLSQGTSVGTAIGCGVARVLKSIHEMHDFQPGEVLVTEMTDPDWEPIIKQAKAIVTNRGGRTCHAAIISRELGIPCLVGCANATAQVPSGKPVTVDCSEGEDGRVYEGILKYDVIERDLTSIPNPKTKICMNLANPDTALQLSAIPNSGVGLARMEFIVSNHIKAHPLALLKPEVLTSAERSQIDALIVPYQDGTEYFVEKLAQGIGMIAGAFYPKPVILRFSDFKTNEYAGLLGGHYFEPTEDNPMLGWRGASRYYDPKYSEGFALECRAVKKVREDYGLDNLDVMIPFCRTVGEAKKVVSEMEANHLSRGQAKEGTRDMRIIGMCEIPSNVILADDFLKIFDGYSIGSNDLTQLVLGVDRNSETVSSLFDERNEAVKKVISDVIATCNKLEKYVGICGQGPSDYPEFAAFLVKAGIQSMSLNPDTVLSTTLMVNALETGKEA